MAATPPPRQSVTKSVCWGLFHLFYWALLCVVLRVIYVLGYPTIALCIGLACVWITIALAIAKYLRRG